MSKELESWRTMDDVDRDFIRRSLGKKGIDIEKILGQSVQPQEENLCPANEKLLTKKEAAGIAKCSISTINRLIKSGTIKTTKFNHARQGAVRILVTSFEAWLKQETVTV